MLLLLLPLLQDSLAVRPYLKGFLLRDAGLEAMIRNMLLCNEQLREVAVKGFALGENHYCCCSSICRCKSHTVLLVLQDVLSASRCDVAVAAGCRLCGVFPRDGHSW
jgi:hypothetical protein